MTTENETQHIRVDLRGYSICGFRKGSSWAIRSRPQTGREERGFLVTDGRIQDAIITEAMRGLPRVRATNEETLAPDSERTAILEAVARWHEFVVSENLG